MLLLQVLFRAESHSTFEELAGEYFESGLALGN